jgi:hypothetical protein
METVKLAPDEISFIKEKVKVIVNKKMKEYTKDRLDVYYRFLPAFLGRWAVCKYLGLPITSIDLTAGKSSKYKTKSAISKYGINVATVRRDRKHIIKKNNIFPIVFVHELAEDEYKIIGLGQVNDINDSNNHDDISTWGSLREKDTKTVFTGYDKLIPVKAFTDYWDKIFEAQKSGGLQ